MAGEAVFVIVVVALVVPFVLYSLVRAEHDQREEMDREDAERAARRDTRGDTLVPEVAACNNGAIIARWAINRAWLERYWSPETNMTVGDYVDRKVATHEGCRKLDTPAEYVEGVPQREWTCADWLDANPDLGDGACFREGSTQ